MASDHGRLVLNGHLITHQLTHLGPEQHCEAFLDTVGVRPSDSTWNLVPVD